MNSAQIYFATAKKYEIDDEQFYNFVAGGYVAQPKQLEFSAAARECDKQGGPVEIACGGGRNSSKSHGAICQVLLDDCVRIPGLKWLFLRSIGKAASESFDDLLRKATPHLFDYYKPSRLKIELPNGSRVLLGGFNSENDIDKYIGIEYDGLVVEEVNLLSNDKVQRLYGSIRSNKWRARKYLTFNPGGIGHAWIRKRFLKPYRDGTEVDTRFIFSKVSDNIYASKEYIAYLNSLTGWLKDAWLEGNFDIDAGQFFTTWRDDVHVVGDFVIDPSWNFWASMDYGFTHYTVVHLHCETHEGTIYTFDEHYGRKRIVEHHASAIHDMLSRHGLGVWQLDGIYAGGDVFSKNQDGRCPADDYADFGLKLERADMSRVQGAAEILKRLGDENIASTWRVHKSCVRLIESIPAMIHDPRRPEDVLKVDCDEDGNDGDDFYDSVRYGLMVQAGRNVGSWGNSTLTDYRG